MLSAQKGNETGIRGTIWKIPDNMPAARPGFGPIREEIRRLGERVQEDAARLGGRRTRDSEERDILAFWLSQKRYADIAQDIYKSSGRVFVSLRRALDTLMRADGIPKAEALAYRDVLNSYIAEESGDFGQPEDPQASVAGSGGYSSYILAVKTLSSEVLFGVDGDLICAVVCESGSPASHCALYLKTLGIPCIFGAVGFYDSVEDGDEITISYDSLKVFSDKVSWVLEDANSLFSTEAPRTLDGTPIPIKATINDLDEIPPVFACTRQGVGLTRSEFLFLSCPWEPSSLRQRLVYSALRHAKPPGEFCVRLFDFGSDKNKAWMKEENKDRLYETQIVALLSAFEGDSINILIPKTVSAEQVVDVKETVIRTLATSRNPARVRLGAMIETLEGVANLGPILSVCDFISIGTNDLSCECSGSGREEADVGRVYSNPVFLGVLQEVLKSADARGIPATVCGEMARSLELVTVLIGLGAKSLSVSVRSIPQTASYVTRAHAPSARELVGRLLGMTDADEVNEALYCALLKPI